MKNKYDIEVLINSRLGMQSTQRTLMDTYGITTPTLKYFTSRAFAEKLASFTSFQKKNFFTIIAGPFNWKAAASFIEKHNNLV